MAHQRKTLSYALTDDEKKLFEGAMKALPTASMESLDPTADAVLKFAYHHNPYLRTFAKVTWAGYALAAGKLADASSRFTQSLRDAELSNIDTSTVRALQAASAALEASLSPEGTVAGFLAELKDKTLRRMWSRVCETAALPPPDFDAIYGIVREPLPLPTTVYDEEPAAPQPAYAENDPDEGGEEGAHEGRDEGDDTAEERAPSARRAPPPPLPPEPATLHGTITRDGTVAEAPEQLLALCADALRVLREKGGTGNLTLKLEILSGRAVGQQAPRPHHHQGPAPHAGPRPERQGDAPREGGQGGRRRRRRRGGGGGAE